MPTCALRQAACGLVLVFAGTGFANAGPFAASPVRVTLLPSRPVEAMTVRNDGSEPTVVQLEAVSWSQQDGKDIYASTNAILATPPIFTLPPGGSQLVRVGLRKPADPRAEQTYRLFLQEVPPPPKPGFQGLQVALRLSVPVFVMPPVAASPALHWQAKAIAPGQVKLNVVNSGNAHAQVINFKLGVAGSSPTNQQVSAYLLPSQSRDWIVKADAVPGASLHLSAKTDAGDSEADLTLGKP